MIRSLKSLSIVSTIGMVFVLLGGALVTKTGSGDGCADSFPLCHGQLIPTDITPELIIEYSHRLVSGIVGISVIAVAILVWKLYGHIREVKFLAIASVFFLLFQAFLGAAAVMWGQSDFVLAAHFGVSLISFATVFILMLIIFEIDRKLDTSTLFIKRKHRIEIYLLTIYTICVVYTGALVRHTNSNLICPDWPFCSNKEPFAFMQYDMYQWIQMGHRLAAGILFIWTISFFIKVAKHYRDETIMFRGWLIASILISLQVLFGALIIFTVLDVGVSLMHSLIITCYFGVLSYFILLATRSAKAEKEQKINENISVQLK